MSTVGTIGIMGILTLFYWLYVTFDVHKGLELLRTLPRAARLPDKPPLVSVIIAAKEEEGTIKETVQHLLTQQYPRIEIIAVNDRSQDATGVRLEELRKWSDGKNDIHTKLQIIHITHLPEGWLGKNHALYQGYLQARGQYLLFTDADILFAPGTITDAVAYMKEHDVHHLTLTPHMMARGRLLKGFVHYFLFSFSLFVVLGALISTAPGNRASASVLLTWSAAALMKPLVLIKPSHSDPMMIFNWACS